MPTLDWLDRERALKRADEVSYRLLESVSSHCLFLMAFAKDREGLDVRAQIDKVIGSQSRLVMERRLIFSGTMPYMLIVIPCMIIMYLWPGMTLRLPAYPYGNRLRPRPATRSAC